MHDTMAVRRVTLHIQVPIHDLPLAFPVLATAMAQFGPTDPVQVIITPEDDTTPDDRHAAQLTQLYASLEPEMGPVGVVTLAAKHEVPPGAADLMIRAGSGPAAEARAMLALMALGNKFGRCFGARLGWTPRAGMAPSRADAIFNVRQRDLWRAGGVATEAPIRVVVILWSPNFWGAVETVYSALAARPDVSVEVVLLDSDQVTFRSRGQLADQMHFIDRGVRPRDEAWLRANLLDSDLVVLPDAYDGSRPVGLQVHDFANAGLRMVYLPYGAFNTADAATLQLVNLPLQNLAWRMYVHGPGELEMYDRHCDVGASHARYLGSVKGERLLVDGREKGAVERIRGQLGTETVLLWNPHWDVRRGGLSTFLPNVDTVLTFFAEHPSRGLIVRPHPRLLLDLERDGDPAHAELVSRFRADCARLGNVYLDEDWDHLPALKAADAMVSDMSSVIPEYLALGRPTGYLPPPEGARYTDDEAWRDSVVELADPARLAEFLAQPTLSPAVQVGDEHLGSGSRVVEQMLADFRFESGRPVAGIQAAVA